MVSSVRVWKTQCVPRIMIDLRSPTDSIRPSLQPPGKGAAAEMVPGIPNEGEKAVPKRTRGNNTCEKVEDVQHSWIQGTKSRVQKVCERLFYLVHIICRSLSGYTFVVGLGVNLMFMIVYNYLSLASKCLWCDIKSWSVKITLDHLNVPLDRLNVPFDRLNAPLIAWMSPFTLFWALLSSWSVYDSQQPPLFPSSSLLLCHLVHHPKYLFPSSLLSFLLLPPFSFLLSLLTIPGMPACTSVWPLNQTTMSSLLSRSFTDT